MSIQKSIIPYEILFRLAADGSVSGCHRRDLEIVTDSESNETYVVKELDPQPIIGDAMDSVLGLVNTGLTASLAVNQAQVNLLNGLLMDSQQSHAAAKFENESLSDLLVSSNERVAELELLVAAVMEERDSNSATPTVDSGIDDSE